MKEQQLLGEIGVQVIDITRTHAKANATEKAKADFQGKKPTEAEFNQRVEEYLTESGFGTGGRYTRAMQAATAAIQGLMNGDLNAALAKGENAAAQATGAMTGEAVGILAESVYKKQPGELTEQEKENVSAWATLASGLAGGLVGGDTQSAANSAQAGKVVVENNAMNPRVMAAAEARKKNTIENWEASKKAEIEKACNGSTPISCQTMTAMEFSVIAWPLLPETAATTSIIGATANMGIQYAFTQSVDLNDVIFAYWTGALTGNTGFWGTVSINASMGAGSAYIKGEDPLMEAGTAGLGSGLGYGFGSGIKYGLNKWGYWKSNGFDPKYNPRIQSGAIQGQLRLSKDMGFSQLPGTFGNAGGAVATEYSNSKIHDLIQKSGNKENESKK
ncbi:VENN motif pre-toxin domain-containing protein [Morganella morganii]|nr:VENN motif pre-toxin domain-containing protein [Morganella morganii]